MTSTSRILSLPFTLWLSLALPAQARAEPEQSSPRSELLPLEKVSNEAHSHAAETITQEELVRRTQELYDAVVPGNQEPWKKYYADDCIFADEKGRQLDKAKLVADITPLPKGYFGAIKIVNPISRIIGDTAILSYDADETETIFGQHLTARYHTVDTWLRRSGVWQIIASQTMRYYEDPAIGRADASKFPDFIGQYELAEGQIRKVFAEGENLYVERNGKREQLLPESADIFFRKGVEGRISSAPIPMGRSTP